MVPRPQDDPALIVGLALAFARQGTSDTRAIPSVLLERLRHLAEFGDPTCRLVLDCLGRTVAEGGYVGGAPSIRKPDLKASNSNTPSGSPVNINTNVTVNASGGTPEQNTDLAGRVGKQIEQQMRSVVADEIRRQSRPGNYLYQQGRR